VWCSAAAVDTRCCPTDCISLRTRCAHKLTSFDFARAEAEHVLELRRALLAQAQRVPGQLRRDLASTVAGRVTPLYSSGWERRSPHLEILWVTRRGHGHHSS
jgi:hypothetical protein